MKPSKLKRHVEIGHADTAKKRVIVLFEKRDEMKQQK
jgi:hypothetical protein